MEKGLAVLSLTGREEEEAWQVDLKEEAMRTTLVNLWHPHGGVKITYMGEKRFLFQFYYEIDLDRAADCNGNLMLKCLGTRESPNKASPLAYAEGD
ncbi:hypothetical protein GOBAR_AA04032 [Gossypium barbadense]|uniref:DUF4283 domain-containing protein n=1 Tax=Gossypium barbadense TaxID=3634 RepID=A0A2P5YLW6_GOSBA|nr:hypothetical protein GOBAR_AA04032 [Gossypium barbadense]